MSVIGNMSVSRLSENEIIIENESFKVLNVPGDGSCFFHCLSLAIHGDLSSSLLYRRLICGTILDNWDLWSQKVNICHGPFMDATMYLAGMINGSWWATACEIEAAAAALNCNIHVWLAGRNSDHQNTYALTTYPAHTDTNSPNDIYLLLERDHFMVLKKLETVFVRIDNFEQSALNEKQNTEQNNEFENPGKAGNSLNDNDQSNNLLNSNLIQDNSTQNEEADEFFYAIPLNSYLNSPKKRKRSVKRTKKSVQSTETAKKPHSDHTHIYEICRKLGMWDLTFSKDDFMSKTTAEVYRISYSIKKREEKLGTTKDSIPDAPPLTENLQFNKAMDCIRAFELEQISYRFHTCSICVETRINMELNKNHACKRCSRDKATVKMFSKENRMNPGPMPEELKNMSVIEQQLIARITPCMNIYMLKHGGIASSGHCVTFPQEVNEPAKIFPRLPHEIEFIKICKKGKNDTSKDFRVRRAKIETALKWLQIHNPAYTDITISSDRLKLLPSDGSLDSIQTIHLSEDISHKNDRGPAPDQIEIANIIDCNTQSGVLFPDNAVNIKDQVENIVKEVLGENATVTENKRGTITIPWPSRGNTPLSEFTTQYFFTLAFPCLFPFGTADFHINRPKTCASLSDWAEHLLWYTDGRFAKHHYFKFVVHNMISRKQTLEKSSFIVKQKLGEKHMTVSELKEKLQIGDTSIAKTILYFSNTLRGTSQYWTQRNKELRSLVQYKINKGQGLPSFFTTGSCAEFHFKPLRRLLQLYVQHCTGETIDFDNSSQLFEALQNYTHIVAQYFDLRTQSYFKNVMSPVFGVDTYWYRQEFAKSRGMVHWHGLCWRHDREPHDLLYKCIESGLSSTDTAQSLAEWAKYEYGLSAVHPAGSDASGLPRKDLWAPPEGTAPPPPEDKNPLVKLLMDVSSSQSSILEDYLLLTNRFNLHRCSDYCLKPMKHKPSIKQCRMEFGVEGNPGKLLRSIPEIVRDKNNSLRLEMPRDHPVLVQNSQYHTQGWRANGDISLILSSSPPDNPSVDEIMSTEKYITGYACKGNQTSDELSDLFSDMVNFSTSSSNDSTQALCNKFLMNTVKRDISAVEASFEISRLPLYRSSHVFKSISLSGFRVLEKDGSVVTKSTALDKYLLRDVKDASSFYSFVCTGNTVPVFSCNTQAAWPLTEDYCKIMLLLHWPNWRKFSDIKPDSTSWFQAFEQFLCSDLCPNFVKADVERAKTKSQNNNNIDAQEEDSPNQSSQQPDWMQVLQPTMEYNIDEHDTVFYDGGDNYDWGQSADKYPLHLANKFIENLDSHSVTESGLRISNIDLCTMNSDQLFAFNIVMHNLQIFKTNSMEHVPLRLIVSGTAGSGKSHLIKCLVKAVRLLFQENRSVQVLCPTGNSANLIGGLTIHSFLKIPTINTSKEMTAPQGISAETLQNNLQSVKVLLIDERSLIGLTTLGWMEFMCRYGVSKGSNSNLSWGGLPVVVFFGDDVQLPPVLDTPVYSTNFKNKSPALLHGVAVWREFSNCVSLSTIIRQSSKESDLRDVLLSLRQYKLTSLHAKWLQNFQWNNLRNKYGDILQDMNDRGLFVFPNNSDVWEHNKSKLIELNKVQPVAKIKAKTKGRHVVNDDKSGGLLNTLFLCKNAKVMLTVNLCVHYGLFNGALGTVIDIVYLNGKRPPEAFPDFVLVHFLSYNGPAFIPEKPKIVPIKTVERIMDCPCHSCKRQQIPLRLGWATSIHKCQGMTIGEGETNRYVIINPGTKAFESRNPGALFVALSRAKSAGDDKNLPDFAWHPSVLVNEDRVCHVVKTPTADARDKEIKRLAKLTQLTKKQFNFLSNDFSICQTIKTIGDNFDILSEE